MGTLVSWLNLDLERAVCIYLVHNVCAVGSELTPEPSWTEPLLSLCVFEFCFCSVHRWNISSPSVTVSFFIFLADSAFNDPCVEKKEKHFSKFFYFIFLNFFTSFLEVIWCGKFYTHTHKRRQNTMINLLYPLPRSSTNHLSAILTFRHACLSFFVCFSIFTQNAGTLFHPSPPTGTQEP